MISANERILVDSISSIVRAIITSVFDIDINKPILKFSVITSKRGIILASITVISTTTNWYMEYIFVSRLDSVTPNFTIISVI